MSITREELLVAAARADIYPAGRGNGEVDLDDIGGPEVAVAAGGPSRLLTLCELHNIDADALKKAAEKKFPKPPPVQTSAKPAKEAKKK